MAERVGDRRRVSDESEVGSSERVERPEASEIPEGESREESAPNGVERTEVSEAPEKEAMEESEPREVERTEVSEAPEKELDEVEAELERALEDLAIRELLRGLEHVEGRSVDDVVQEALDKITPEGEVSETEPPSSVAPEDIERVKEQHPHLERRPETKRFEEEDPRLISQLEHQEEKRIEHESLVSDEALEHRIDPEKVRESMADVLERDSRSVEDLTDALERLHSAIERPEVNSVHYAELYDSDKSLVEDRLREAARDIRENRAEIEDALNRRLGLDKDSGRELRVAVTDDRIYYWHKDASHDKWLNVLAQEKFYFRSIEDKNDLLKDFQHHLQFRNASRINEGNLNDLVRQLSRLDMDSLRAGIRREKENLRGEQIHLVKDVLGKSFDELTPRFSYVGEGRRSGISELKWPEIHDWKMKTVAIAESDCYLSPDGSFTYTEKDDERRNLAIKHFQEFGEFKARESPCSERQRDLTRVRLPIVFGRMAEYWGVPEGDKAIQNRGLSSSVVNESISGKIKYLREVVGEDGTFGRRFGITRANVLHAGNRAEKYRENYGIEPKVSQKDIKFIQSISDPMSKNLCYEEGERVRVRVSALKEMAKSDDPRAPEAARLMKIINRERNQLLDDEKDHIIEPLGIKTSDHSTYITYYKKSERLSIEWIVKTKTKEDAIRWALLAPPNHPQKMEKVVEFIRNDPEKVRKVTSKLLGDGLEIHPDWTKYGL